MLRGCVGLDITSFCVLILNCASTCLDGIFDQMSIDKRNNNETDDDMLWEHWFDFACVVKMLLNLE